MMSVAHASISPDAGSRQPSKSMPTNGSSGVKTKPTPRPAPAATAAHACSNVPQVAGLVDDAPCHRLHLPAPRGLGSIGTLVSFPFRFFSQRQTTNWVRPRNAAGTFAAIRDVSGLRSFGVAASTAEVVGG